MIGWRRGPGGCFQLSAAVGLALLAGPTALPGNDRELARVWRAAVAMPDAGVVRYAAAVCQDGTVFVSDGQGALALLDERGNVAVAARRVRGAIGAQAIACDSAGALLAVCARTSEVVRIEAFGAGFRERTVSSLSPPILALRAVGGAGGSMFVLGPGGGDGRGLHVVDASGRVRPVGAATPAGSAAPELAGDELASVLWDAGTGQFLLVTQVPIQVYRYGEDGGLAAVVSAPSNLFAGYGNLVEMAAVLPGGLLAFDLEDTTRAAPRWMVVTDRKLALRGVYGMQGGERLVGADGLGDLFFLAHPDPSTVALTMSRLP